MGWVKAYVMLGHAVIPVRKSCMTKVVYVLLFVEIRY